VRSSWPRPCPCAPRAPGRRAFCLACLDVSPSPREWPRRHACTLPREARSNTASYPKVAIPRSAGRSRKFRCWEPWFRADLARAHARDLAGCISNWVADAVRTPVSENLCGPRTGMTGSSWGSSRRGKPAFRGAREGPRVHC